MVRFGVNVVFVLAVLAISVTLVSLTVWVIVKLLRSVFPEKFTASSVRSSDEV